MSIIKRYMVYRDEKLVSYENTIEEAKNAIQRQFNHKKEQVFAVHDLEQEKDVYIGDFIQLLHAEVKANKTKKEKAKLRKKPKAGRSDIIDDDYSRWLGLQPCVITGKTAKRGIGADNIHCHHIYGRSRGRNDHLQVPLMGYVHSWGNKSYHSASKSDFNDYWGLNGVDVVELFLIKAEELRAQYLELTKV